MDIAELLKKAGIEADEEKTKAMQAAVDEAEKSSIEESLENGIKALKSKNDELISEKRAMQERESTAKADAEKASEALIKEKGTAEELKKFYEEREETRQSALVEAQKVSADLKLSSKKAEIFGNHLKHFKSQPAGKAVLKELVHIDEEGNAVYKGFDGKVIASNAEEFNKYLNESEDTKYLVLGTQASGGGAAGSDNGSPADTSQESKFKTLLSKKDKTHAESLELSKMANEMRQKTNQGE